MNPIDLIANFPRIFGWKEKEKRRVSFIITKFGNSRIKKKKSFHINERFNLRRFQLDGKLDVTCFWINKITNGIFNHNYQLDSWPVLSHGSYREEVKRISRNNVNIYSW